MAAYALATRGANVLAYVRRHGTIGFFAGTMSVLGYLAFLAATKTLHLGPVVALRETSVIFGTLIGTLVFREAFGLRRVTASVKNGILASTVNTPTARGLETHQNDERLG